MAKTKLRQESTELEAKFMPDHSEVLYTFADGWTIRKLTTYADAREGTLMSNCFLPDDHEDFALEDWQEHPETRWFFWDSETDTQVDMTDKEDCFEKDVFPQWGDLTKLDLSYDLPTETISLRDIDNIPHATSTYKDELGRNNSDLKPKYKQKLDHWAKVEAAQEANGEPTWTLVAVAIK